MLFHKSTLSLESLGLVIVQVWDYLKFHNQSVQLLQLRWEYHQIEDFKLEMGPIHHLGLGVGFHQDVVINLQVIMRLILTLEQVPIIRVTPPYADLLVSI